MLRVNDLIKERDYAKVPLADMTKKYGDACKEISSLKHEKSKLSEDLKDYQAEISALEKEKAYLEAEHKLYSPLVDIDFNNPDHNSKHTLYSAVVKS